MLEHRRDVEGNSNEVIAVLVGVFLCACLAMGVYIAFDVLDLDRSELRDSLPGNAIAAEPAQAETDRVLPQNPMVPQAPNLCGRPLAGAPGKQAV